jgi:hypothetical protein
MTADGRRALVHAATVELPPGGDERAPGAAITVALCGSWDHPPPCPLAPHHTAAVRVGEELSLRTVAVVEPGLEELVRARIEAGLRRGELAGPDGRGTTWRVRTSGPAELRDAERERAERLARGPRAAG